MDQAVKVLIVDDDKTILKMLQQVFKNTDQQCSTALSGDEALKLLKTDPTFDLVLTDISMPGMDGIELTRKITKKYPEIPIIVMTGFTEDYTFDKVIEAGAADFIKKPFTIKEVMSRIARVQRDSEILKEIRKKEHKLEKMGTEMISGIEGESRTRLQELQDEITTLRKQLW
ncbi:MAG: response regulator [Proteobacteria bacterium]|nr:response regulator [Pseudomonadota bacterium]MBU1711139.1 response regulator [Pseudomonadota bacterium]